MFRSDGKSLYICISTYFRKHLGTYVLMYVYIYVFYNSEPPLLYLRTLNNIIIKRLHLNNHDNDMGHFKYVAFYFFHFCIWNLLNYIGTII